MQYLAIVPFATLLAPVAVIAGSLTCMSSPPSGTVSVSLAEASPRITSFCDTFSPEISIVPVLVRTGNESLSLDLTSLGFPVNDNASSLWFRLSFAPGDVFGSFSLNASDCKKAFIDLMNGVSAVLRRTLTVVEVVPELTHFLVQRWARYTRGKHHFWSPRCGIVSNGDCGSRYSCFPPSRAWSPPLHRKVR